MKATTITNDFESILDNVSTFEEVAAEMKETLLANIVMIGEVPAPTFEEAARVDFVRNRFTECGLQNCSTDEKGNGFGVLQGTSGEEETILVVAHADTVFGADASHTVSVQPDHVTGAGLGDNTVGLAALATLPTLLERLDLRLEHDLLLMASSQSLGRGNLQGLRFFLHNNRRPLLGGVCVEGVGLGRLSYKSLGMIRSEATISVPDEYDWTRFGAASAITILNRLINRLLEIPNPAQPRTSINFGAVQGGSSFSTTATNASLRFEVRSESSERAKALWNDIENIVAELASDSGAEITLTIFAQREPGGIPFADPLVRRTRDIMQRLSIEDRAAPSMSELAALIDAGIPSITLGMAHGKRSHKIDEEISIASLFTGMAQLLGTVLAIDRGFTQA